MIAIGRELAAAGLGLGITGAVFLAWGMTRAPVAIASDLFVDLVAEGEVRPRVKGTTVNSWKLDQYSRGILYGRAGLVALVLGFLLQLIGLITPAGDQVVLPLLFSALAALVAIEVGRSWVRRVFPALTEEIVHSYRISATGSLEEWRRLPRQYQYRPDWVTRWIARALS